MRPPAAEPGCRRDDEEREDRSVAESVVTADEGLAYSEPCTADDGPDLCSGPSSPAATGSTGADRLTCTVEPWLSIRGTSAIDSRGSIRDSVDATVASAMFRSACVPSVKKGECRFISGKVGDSSA